MKTSHLNGLLRALALTIVFAAGVETASAQIVWNADSDRFEMNDEIVLAVFQDGDFDPIYDSPGLIGPPPGPELRR